MFVLAVSIAAYSFSWSEVWSSVIETALDFPPDANDEFTQEYLDGMREWGIVVDEWADCNEIFDKLDKLALDTYPEHEDYVEDLKLAGDCFSVLISMERLRYIVWQTWQAMGKSDPVGIESAAADYREWRKE
ncbi:MAG: hypothetical protein OXE95_07605 [Chloroflexi bacterium]|nr:hypothetical protein [Chloroflexota bacterium]MCY4247422.1 hypothetical protein [Chloroflexota bacterium]